MNYATNELARMTDPPTARLISDDDAVEIVQEVYAELIGGPADRVDMLIEAMHRLNIESSLAPSTVLRREVEALFDGFDELLADNANDVGRRIIERREATGWTTHTNAPGGMVFTMTTGDEYRLEVLDRDGGMIGGARFDQSTIGFQMFGAAKMAAERNVQVNR